MREEPILRGSAHLFVVSVLLLAACTTMQTTEYRRGEIPPADPRRRIVAVTQVSGVRVTFDRAAEDSAVASARIEEGAVVGTADGRPVRIDLSDASSVWIEETRTGYGRTLLLVAGLGVGIPFLMRRFD